MFETVVIATDGSASAERSVAVALDLAERFEATVHALYVVDQSKLAGSPEPVREELAAAYETQAEAALASVTDDVPEADRGDVVTAVREGSPAAEIVGYAREHDADLVATGTRGRHGEHSFVLGSVAEGLVKRSSVPVLTVRQLEAGEETDEAAA